MRLDAWRYGAMSWPSAGHRANRRDVKPGSFAAWTQEPVTSYPLSRSAHA